MPLTPAGFIIVAALIIVVVCIVAYEFVAHHPIHIRLSTIVGVVVVVALFLFATLTLGGS